MDGEHKDHSEEWRKGRHRRYAQQYLFDKDFLERLWKILEAELTNHDIDRQLDAILSRFKITRPGDTHGK